MASRILVPQPGSKPMPLAVETQSLNHWTNRKVPEIPLSDANVRSELKERNWRWQDQSGTAATEQTRDDAQAGTRSSRDITIPTCFSTIQKNLVAKHLYHPYLCFLKPLLISLFVKNNIPYLYLLIIYNGERNGNPLQYSCLANPMYRRAWWTRVRGVAKGSDMTQRLNNNHFK